MTRKALCRNATGRAGAKRRRRTESAADEADARSPSISHRNLRLLGIATLADPAPAGATGRPTARRNETRAHRTAAKKRSGRALQRRRTRRAQHSRSRRRASATEKKRPTRRAHTQPVSEAAPARGNAQRRASKSAQQRKRAVGAHDARQSASVACDALLQDCFSGAALARAPREACQVAREQQTRPPSSTSMQTRTRERSSSTWLAHGTEVGRRRARRSPEHQGGLPRVASERLKRTPRSPERRGRPAT